MGISFYWKNRSEQFFSGNIVKPVDIKKWLFMKLGYATLALKNSAYL